MNAQGLTDSKIQSILALNKSIKRPPDVLCFSEAWFTPNASSMLEIPGYNSYHIVRSERLHGGVSIYVNKLLK